MRKVFMVALFVAAACLLPDRSHAANAAAAETEAAARAYSGQIIIDAANHGEAWWVNPQSLQRVYLGRPDEALERLTRRAVRVSFNDISRLAESEGLPGDTAYAQTVSGQVLAPNDVIGAAWYVSPSLGIRLRLATPDDAWSVMKAGTPVAAATLQAIAVEAEVEPPPAGEHVIKEIKSADTLVIDDGTEVRLSSVDIPSNPDLQQAAMDRIAVLTAGKKVVLESDVRDTDGEGVKIRFARVGDIDLSYDLVRNGLAFHDIIPPNFKYAEMLIVGSLDAMNQKKGFWRQK